MNYDNIIGINNLSDLEKFLTNKEFSSENPAFLYYDSKNKIFVLKADNLPSYRKAPEITKSIYFFDIKLLETIHNNYIPIYDLKTKKLLFSYNDFLNDRRKISGIDAYQTGNFIFSDNLYFKGLDQYLNAIDDNIKMVNLYRKAVYKEIISKLESLKFKVTIGSNSGGDIELVEAGSTARYTNIPSFNPTKKWDFDFTVRFSEDKTWLIKNVLENNFIAGNHITKTSRYKVRLTDVLIPGLDNKVDLDFSLTPQLDKYLSTEEALKQRLDNMKLQDEEKYRLVLANIMYAKHMLKNYGAYKPSRGILEGDRMNGGLGGVGIENWILQNGGSLIDATNEFLRHSEGKDFKEFEQEYAIMDCGANHVGKSKNQWPYDNFIINNMRYLGYEKMCICLQKFKNSLDNDYKFNTSCGTR